MKIYHCQGWEFEKSLPNSPEDLFNGSEAVYDDAGRQKKLTVTYVRYFDTYVQENHIYDPEKTSVPFYHLVALLILLKNGGKVNASRLYYNDTNQFLEAFNPEDIPKALEIYRSLHKEGNPKEGGN